MRTMPGGLTLYAKASAPRSAVIWAYWSLYALVTAIVIGHHEPWRDEAYAWLIARELSLVDIYREAAYSAAPALWYYVLAVPAKLGLPYESMQLIHWMGACVTAYLFLRNAPFSLPLKIACIFSYYFAYEHAVVARVYMGSILFIFAACSLYPSRMQHPARYGIVVFLLANTSFFGVLAAGYFLADSFITKPQIRRRFQLLMALGVCIGLMNILPRPDAYDYYKNHFNFYKPERLKEIFGLIYFPEMPGALFDDAQSLVVKYVRNVLALFSIASFVLCVILPLRERAYLISAFLAGAACMMIYLAVFKYPWAGGRHYSFLIVYMIMSLWLLAYHRKPAEDQLTRAAAMLLGFGFALSSGIMLLHAYREVNGMPYSGAQSMAAYIREMHLGDEIIVADSTEFGVSVLPYLPGSQLWDPEKERFVRYSHSDETSRRNLSFDYMRAMAQARFPADKPVYFLTHVSIMPPDDRYFRLMYLSAGAREGLALYRMKPAVP